MTFMCRDGLHRHCDGVVVDLHGPEVSTERCGCECHVFAEVDAVARARVLALH